MTEARYEYRILQEGSLPQGTGDSIDLDREHRCTSTLIWPEGSRPDAGDAAIIDPCFTVAGFEGARAELARLGLPLAGIRWTFITHAHGDRFAAFLRTEALPTIHDIREPAGRPPPRGLAAVPCPGHTEELEALRLRGIRGESIWPVGDAVIDAEWLRE